MEAPVRVCIWATTLGPDLLALAWDLERAGGCELRVAADDPASVASQPSLRLRPLRHSICGKGIGDVRALRRFAPDVVVVDNMVPWAPLARAGLVLWHGYGWKGPNDPAEMRFAYVTLSIHFGSPLRANRRLRWACFGPQDLEHRTRVGRIHPDVCALVGATSHDILRHPAEREPLEPYYRMKIAKRRNVLVAPTWHYGGLLGHWGNEEALLDDLVRRTRLHGANVILRLHDRWRYSREILSTVERVASRWDNVELKFKDRHPDALADLQVADVLITNLSSIANLFYATEKPTIHVFPVRAEQAPFEWRHVWLGRVRSRTVETVREIWKLRPEQNGGLLARTHRELLTQLDQALESPSCCRDRARAFLDAYMLGADGNACARARAALDGLAQAGRRSD